MLEKFTGIASDWTNRMRTIYAPATYKLYHFCRLLLSDRVLILQIKYNNLVATLIGFLKACCATSSGEQVLYSSQMLS